MEKSWKINVEKEGQPENWLPYNADEDLEQFLVGK